MIDETLGLAWRAPSSQVSIIQSHDGLDTEASFGLDVGSQKAEFIVLSRYKPTQRRLDVGIRFSKVFPSFFAHLVPKLAVLSAVRVPVAGTIDVGMSVDGEVDSVGFSLSGGQGKNYLADADQAVAEAAENLR